MVRESGRAEVWLRPFADGLPLRVSAEGGHEPRWSRDGRTIFYQNGAKMMSAEVALGGGEPRAGTPRVLFEGGLSPSTPA